jgi:hypothetical protein
MSVPTGLRREWLRQLKIDAGWVDSMLSRPTQRVAHQSGSQLRGSGGRVVIDATADAAGKIGEKAGHGGNLPEGLVDVTVNELSINIREVLCRLQHVGDSVLLAGGGHQVAIGLVVADELFGLAVEG